MTVPYSGPPTPQGQSHPTLGNLPQGTNQQAPQQAPPGVTTPGGQMFVPQQPAPQQQPHPTVPFGQVPQQQMQQALPQAPAGINPNTVLSGPNVPPELQGRTWGQAMQVYGMLTNHYLASQGRGQQPAPPKPQAQPQAQPQQQGNGAQMPDDVREMFTRPKEFIRGVVQEAVSEAVAPANEQAEFQRAMAAQQMARQSIPDFQQLEPHMVRQLATMERGALMDVNTWIAVADLVRGQLYRQGQYSGRPPVQQQGWVPAQALPQSYFTESPTAVGGGQQQQGLTQDQVYTSQKFNMDPALYNEWRSKLQIVRS